MPKLQSPNVSTFEIDVRLSLNRLLSAGQGVLLAVSGGRDSMALMHAVARLRDDLMLPQLVVAHLNHGLRGEAGRQDAELVRTACATLNVPIVISECAEGQLEQASCGSVEEAARLARYEFLRATAEVHGIPVIATAHYAADQAETVLHNILRGTGLRGLRGMPERRRLSESVELIRPMLNFADRTIAEFVQHHGIPFATDASNVDTRFTRNRIRHSLLPQLRRDFNTNVPEALIGLAAQTQDLLQSLDVIAETLLTEAILEQTQEFCRMNATRLQLQPESIVRHALTVLWQQQNWPRREMNRSHWNRLTAMVFDKSSPPSIDFPGGVRAELRGQLWAISHRRQE